MAELLSSGKVAGYQGLHVNSVWANPALAADPDNIEFVRQAGEHVARHGGNLRNPTTGGRVKRDS